MKIMVIVAHPDDEILGCGGTIAKLSNDNDIYSLILGEGITSRDNWKKEDLENLKQECIKANKEVGVKEIFLNKGLSDNAFDKVPLLDIIKIISRYTDKIKPDIVFTHFRHDLNIDHRIVFNAVITVCRPIKNESVKEIYSFEVLSSTEWNFPYVFKPNVFYDISETINTKMKAYLNYKSEIRNSPHSRSLNCVISNANVLGEKIGCNYAEAFELVRLIK